jgi:hypothetical protein
MPMNSLMRRMAPAVLGLALLAGCDGGPTDPVEPVRVDTASGSIACMPENPTVPNAESVDVVRTDAEYDALFWTPCASPSDYPPRPGSGQMLIVVSRAWSGCGGHVRIVRVESSEGAGLTAVIDTCGGGDCDALGVAGAWASVPLSDRPVSVVVRQFTEHPAPCPG